MSVNVPANGVNILAEDGNVKSSPWTLHRRQEGPLIGSRVKDLRSGQAFATIVTPWRNDPPPKWHPLIHHDNFPSKRTSHHDFAVVCRGTECTSRSWGEQNKSHTVQRKTIDFVLIKRYSFVLCQMRKFPTFHLTWRQDFPVFGHGHSGREERVHRCLHRLRCWWWRAAPRWWTPACGPSRPEQYVYGLKRTKNPETWSTSNGQQHEKQTSAMIRVVKSQLPHSAIFQWLLDYVCY